MSALRGVCEDLISLAYLRRMPIEDRREFTTLLINQTVADGLEVQQAFFSANNPFQPVLVPLKVASAKGSSHRDAARKAVRALHLFRIIELCTL